MMRLAGLAILVMSLMSAAGENSWADMDKAAPALQVAAGSKAIAHNKEGVEHYNQGHFDAALKHFQTAVKDDPLSAEAHYNFALTLDKTGDHKGATEHFKTAYDLGKKNQDIQNSDILKKHLKMK
jgi:Tfp pilus assembly protein PilF